MKHAITQNILKYDIKYLNMDKLELIKIYIFKKIYLTII